MLHEPGGSRILAPRYVEIGSFTVPSFTAQNFDFSAVRHLRFCDEYKPEDMQRIIGLMSNLEKLEFEGWPNNLHRLSNYVNSLK